MIESLKELHDNMNTIDVIAMLKGLLLRKTNIAKLLQVSNPTVTRYSQGYEPSPEIAERISKLANCSLMRSNGAWFFEKLPVTKERKRGAK